MIAPPETMAAALVLVPAVAGAAAFVIRRHSARRGLLIAGALVHALLTADVCLRGGDPGSSGWLVLDATARLFLGITSALFLTAAVYALGYLRREPPDERHDFQEDVLFSNAPEAVLTGCLLLFLATMSLVVLSRNLGLLWVAIEATTLVSAPMIYFHRHHRSLEATWKYLLICSVGIAVALLGNFCLAVAAAKAGQGSSSLGLDPLVRNASHLNVPWLKAAFIFLLVGYGTKMGLAPLHTWLPDAHSEAPSVVSALLSGALLNCAFVGILRAQQVLAAAGEAAFGQGLLLILGLLSIGLAGVFILGQTDFKRTLAYSSVEHIGILALGVGLGGAGAFGSMLHAVNHSLAKGMLFLLAGNILAEYRTKSTAHVRGVPGALPVTGVLWGAGFLAICGLPPFGLFTSELTILKAALDQGRTGVAVAYLALLALVFVGLTTTFLGMLQGRTTTPGAGRSRRESVLEFAPPMALGALVLAMGVYVPPALSATLHEVARTLGGF